MNLNCSKWRQIIYAIDDIFCSDKHPHIFDENMAAHQASTYLTYNGLLKIIFASRSGTAYRFQDWASSVRTE